jgi:cell division protein FtsL
MPPADRITPLSSALLPRPKGRASSVGPLRIAIAIALVVAAALAHVHLRLQVIEMGYAISREGKLKHDLQDQNQKLRLELATRRDPAMVERRAREELRMAPPDPAQIREARIEARGPASVAVEGAR